jgi:hypothetical protein
MEFGLLQKGYSRALGKGLPPPTINGTGAIRHTYSNKNKPKIKAIHTALNK